MDLKKLYKRSFTAIFFGLSVLFLILFNDLTRNIFLWIVAFLCVYEYLQIRLKKDGQSKMLYIYALVSGSLLPILSYLNLFNFNPLLPLVVISVLYHLYLGGRLFFNYTYIDIFYNQVLSAFLYLGFPILLFAQYIAQEEKSAFILLSIILLLWASDTFAYFAGSLFGKNKLMPAVSPGKTVEGAVGGGVFAILTSYLLFLFFPIGSLMFHIFLGLIVWLFGLIGDLVESHLKRNYNLKDSGNLLPGHGGFLDRFDSFVYVLPFVLLFFLLF